MSRPVVIRSLAEADIAGAALWYEQQGSGLGARFLDALQDAVHRATVRPRAHLLLRRRPEVRRVLVTGFPYRIFFVAEPERLVVIRVLHGTRRDEPWTGAVSEPAADAVAVPPPVKV